MKLFKNYLSALAIFALLFTSCSKDEVGIPIDDSSENSVVLTFGAVLNDLANRSMNKNHFDQVPDCSDAVPAVALIGLSVGGVAQPLAKVNILSDSDGYFTAYSDALKIPVPGDGSVEVTVTSFKVYDGDPDSGGEIIWIAPVAPGDFTGYVNNPLPYSFDLEAGSKPYIDIEVLCFDRRMVNEYGYVFFDILPETIYPLCLFVNYCNEDGRHWVADYAVDLYFGTNTSGIKLYDHLNPTAMAQTGVINGQFVADPLCLVVPGPPANLPANQPYLYLVIYPNDWAANYGNINNTPVSVQLTWEMVEDLLNGDGTTNEYLHLLVGECEGALPGDGNGNGECDLENPLEDCDNDGVLNGVDECPTVWGTSGNNGCPEQECDLEDPLQDCDNDGVLNGVDDCPTVPGIEANNGCPEDPCAIENPDTACDVAFFEGSQSFTEIVEPGATPTFYALLDGEVSVGSVTVSINASGDPVVIINMGFGFSMDDYRIEVSQNSDGSNSTCKAQNDVSPPTGEDPDVFVIFDETANYVYPFYLNIEANYCPNP